MTTKPHDPNADNPSESVGNTEIVSIVSASVPDDEGMTRVFEPRQARAADDTAPHNVILPPTPSWDATPFPQGYILDHKYQLLGLIGEGGQSVVFEARDVRLDRLVAIKLVHSRHRLSPDFAGRALQEAQLIARIEHQHIVRVYDVGSDSQGRPYIVMERLRGPALTQVVQAQGGMPWRRAVHVAIQLCSALECAHGRGVVHRDVKPSNCILESEGEGDFLKLLDLGIAKRETGDFDAGTVVPVTELGVILGTPGYIAPEILQGTAYDHRVDIYGVGVTLHYLITGRLPAGAEPFRLIQDHLVPAKLNDAIRTALRSNPDERYASAGTLSRTLEKILADSEQVFRATPVDPSSAPPPPESARSPGVQQHDVPTESLVSGATARALAKRAPTPDKPRSERRIGWFVFLALTGLFLATARKLSRLIHARTLVSRRALRRRSPPTHTEVGTADSDALRTVLPPSMRSAASSITLFLDSIFRAYTAFAANTLQLGTPRFHLALNHEFFALFIGESGVAGNAVSTLGTMAFVDHFDIIEDALLSIPKNVRKMVLVITDSRAFGVGIRVKIQEYREEFGIVIIPLRLAELQAAARSGADGTTAAMDLFLTRVSEHHADESRGLSTMPCTDASTLTGCGMHFPESLALLQGERAGLLLVRGPPLAGRTSLINAILAESRFTHVFRVGHSHAIDPGARFRGLPPDDYAAPRVAVVFDDPCIDEFMSSATTIVAAIRDQLLRGRFVFASCWRMGTGELGDVLASASAGFARLQLCTLPLLPRSFTGSLRTRCRQKNVELPDATSQRLHEASGGYVGIALRILNGAIRLRSARRPDGSFGAIDRLSVLPEDITASARALALSGQTVELYLRRLSPVEIAILLAIAHRRPATPDRLARSLEYYGAHDAILRAWMHLQDAGIVKQGDGPPTITIDILREWANLQNAPSPARSLRQYFGSLWSSSAAPARERSDASGTPAEPVDVRPEPPEATRPHASGHRQVRAFVSYTEQDRSFKLRLDTHLGVLKRLGFVNTWSEECILPGSERGPEIAEQLEKAEIIILLISADYINSQQCWERDRTTCLARHQKNLACIVPILCRDVDLTGIWFEHIFRLPRNRRSVVQHDDRELDKVWQEISEEIRILVEKRQPVTGYSVSG